MEEYIDILDENGGGTGKIALKKEVHDKGLWYKACHVWFVNSSGELLIQHRSENKKAKPGMWDISVSGHVSAGESSSTSALREIEEEIGVILKEVDLKLFGKNITQQFILNNGTYIINQLNDLYIVEKDIPISEMTMQESEVQGLKYIPWRELKEWVDSGYEKLVPHPEEYKLLFELLKEKEK